jgi:hypothetical protein
VVAGANERRAYAVVSVFALHHEALLVQAVEPEAVIGAARGVQVGELVPSEGPPAAVHLAQPDDPPGGDRLLHVAERISEMTVRVDGGGAGEMMETT